MASQVLAIADRKHFIIGEMPVVQAFVKTTRHSNGEIDILQGSLGFTAMEMETKLKIRKLSLESL